MAYGQKTQNVIDFYAEHSRIWMKLAEQWRTSSRTTVYSMTSRRFIWRHATENACAVQRRMSKTLYDSKNYVICLIFHRENVDIVIIGCFWKKCITN